MQKVLLLFAVLCLAVIALAGPGTHRFEQPHDSNYGNDKDNKE